KERAQLDATISTMQKIETSLNESAELFTLAVQEDHEDTAAEVIHELGEITKKIEELEFQRMFCGELDANSAYMDVQSGSGGTEAQDWAEMLLRMYLRWGERHGFKAELIEASAGEVAGIKSATVKFTGPYAYG